MARTVAKENIEVHRVKDALGITFTHAKRLLRDNSFSDSQLAILNSETGGALTKLLVTMRPELSLHEMMETPIEVTRKELAYTALEQLGIDTVYDLAKAINRLG
ncbi:hypothetical protein DRQ29_03640 [bacterium]|nr:MAG: hypothetical protein DRQ29_03640 [bacterium]